MFTVEITITGNTHSDIAMAIEEAAKRIEQEDTCGHDKNETRSFIFIVEGEASMSAQDAIDAASEKGSVEISDGVYLNSQDHMLAEQEGWNDEDPSKTVDFRAAPFWITTNDGHIAPVDDANDQELQDTLAD